MKSLEEILAVGVANLPGATVNDKLYALAVIELREVRAGFERSAIPADAHPAVRRAEKRADYFGNRVHGK